MFLELTALPRPVKTLILVSVDALIAGVSFWLAVVIRVGSIPDVLARYAIPGTVLVMMLVPAMGIACGFYQPLLRFEIPSLPVRASLVSGFSSAVIAVAARVEGAALLSSIGLGVVFGLLVFASLIWSRHVARRLLGRRDIQGGTPIALYGASAAGRQLVAMFRRGHDFRPAAYIDDDPSLRGRMVEDLSVIHSGDRDIVEQLHSHGVKEILLAIPSLRSTRRREILAFLGDLPFRVRSVPGLTELMTGKRQDVGDLREISIEDLLGRDLILPLPGLLAKCVKDKAVLVTGGGGSIGSELCRQVLAILPRQLIVLESSELALYQIEQELRAAQAQEQTNPNPGARLEFVLGSMADEVKVTALLERFGVDTVYHAAAYKHVPIVEENPVEGLCNNVLGTWHLARAAAQAKVAHFILISSDKAVRPTNVMGATKRMAELVVQMLAERHPDTVFSMVRFGNVLGSSGSVVPLFRSQIEHGGPITLTHPEMTRYFMTIEEAVQLVIQAGAMASGGEVFVLDMGEPVRIHDLAVKMIHLSGRSIRERGKPDGDIGIEVIGLRPGEKLYEELLIGGEAKETAHPRIWQVREYSVVGPLLEAELRDLDETIRENLQAVDVRCVLAKWVSGYSGLPGNTIPTASESGQRDRAPLKSLIQ